ncbi:MAG: hypothetical protein ACRYGM_16090 [Janthinobacterium lividum]
MANPKSEWVIISARRYHSLWVHLADRAGQENDLDVRAAAGLAGMALGLRAG